MATQQKFYLLDGLTTNTGIMPGASDAFFFSSDATGDATGARTARATDAAPGSSNPDIEATFTANADKLSQTWGWRRFVSPPLAAVSLIAAQGNWTFGIASYEANAGHNQTPHGYITGWRPSSGIRVSTTGGGAGTGYVSCSGVEPGTTEQWQTFTGVMSAAGLTLIDGDILVIELSDAFIQGGAGSAWTSTFCYDGTTEASTTTAASYVNAPVALTLYTPTGIYAQPCNLGSSPGLLMDGATWLRERSRIFVPRLWLPDPPAILIA